MLDLVESALSLRGTARSSSTAAGDGATVMFVYFDASVGVWH